MTIARAVVVVAVVALGSAAAVALASRTPAEIRHADPGDDVTDPELGAHFTDEQVARHGRYRAPGYLAIALGTIVEIVTLIVLARGPFGRLAEWSATLPGGWPVRAAVLAVAAALTLSVALLPLAFVRGFAMEHAWGLSTQGVGGWLGDRAKSAAIGAVVAAIVAIAFFGIVRWQPRMWWLWGWAAFTLLSAIATIVWPVVIAPLFNRFTPIQDRTLETRVTDLAAEAGVDIDRVLIADASRRTTAENAYVAGLGATKRMVLYDTLVAAGSEDETAQVVAHELGHEVEDHVYKNVLLASVALFGGFAALAWLAGRSGLCAWGGASGIGDPRAIPLLLLFTTVAGLLLLPVENAISRRFERRADEIAIELTDDPDTAVRTFRRLAFANLADLRPPSIAVATLYSHPPVRERIRLVLVESRARGLNSSPATR